MSAVVERQVAEEILERHATNKADWPGWADHLIRFKVGPARAELHSSYQGFRDLYSVHVKRKRRGQGHGRRLMDVVIAYADATGCGMRLSVEVDNKAAVHLYESVGFTTTYTRDCVHHMARYPARIPATPEWDAHFEAKLRRLEQDNEPAPEGPDVWAEARAAIDAAVSAAHEEVGALNRDRYSGSANYNDNTRRMYRDAFGAALLESGWTITRTR